MPNWTKKSREYTNKFVNFIVFTLLKRVYKDEERKKRLEKTEIKQNSSLKKLPKINWQRVVQSKPYKH